MVRQSTVAIEDERFYKHQGVDINAIVRAGIKNLESGKTVQGGSTITQQLVRALYIRDPKRDFKRKIREAKLASELEEKQSKRWILHQYLNSIPYGTVGGRTAIGIHAAAVTFFDKAAKDLTLPEAALLAGLPQAPSQYNPFRNPATAVQRRNEVLRAMADNGYITIAEQREAAQAPLKLKRGMRYITRREPYFFDYVQEQLIERYGVGVVRRGGLRIFTTIDPKMQEDARNAINAYYGDPAGPSSAIVAVNPRDGKIRAMASSGTYDDRVFNIAAQGQSPARLGLQDDGAHCRGDEGHRPGLDDATRRSRSTSTTPSTASGRSRRSATPIPAPSRSRAPRSPPTTPSTPS